MSKRPSFFLYDTEDEEEHTSPPSLESILPEDRVHRHATGEPRQRSRLEVIGTQLRRQIPTPPGMARRPDGRFTFIDSRVIGHVPHASPEDETIRPHHTMDSEPVSCI
jgi:hypothetical protein